jgi:hypothetical protein
MKLNGPQIIKKLRENLPIDSGRHLYGVLGTYAQLEAFEKETLSQTNFQAPGTDDLNNRQTLPKVVNLNLALMERIGDDDLRELVRSEGKRPQTILHRLNQTFDSLLASLLQTDRFLVLKHIELLFAYELDLQAIRARATNQNHILLLLPGEKRGDHVALFTESSSRFHRELPYQLIADNHLWELDNDIIART